MDLSVVIPVRNEAPSLEELHLRTGARRSARSGRPYELIIVDDGSTDESFDDPGRLQASDPRLRVIRFRRNFGQTAAFAAGFALRARPAHRHLGRRSAERSARHPAHGRACSSEGYDIVCGWRKDRKDAFLTRRLPSMIANRLISSATGVHLHDYGCSLKVFRARGRQAAEAVRRDAPLPAGDRQREGVAIAEVVVNHRARRHGRLEVRHLAHDPRHARSADGEVPAELFDAAAADLRADRLRHGRAGAAITGCCLGLREAVRRSVDRRTGRCCCSASCWSSPACSSSRSACSPRCRRARTTSRRTSRPT